MFQNIAVWPMCSCFIGFWFCLLKYNIYWHLPHIDEAHSECLYNKVNSVCPGHLLLCHSCPGGTNDACEAQKECALGEDSCFKLTSGGKETKVFILLY